MCASALVLTSPAGCTVLLSRAAGCAVGRVLLAVGRVLVRLVAACNSLAVTKPGAAISASERTGWWAVGPR